VALWDSRKKETASLTERVSDWKALAEIISNIRQTLADIIGTIAAHTRAAEAQARAVEMAATVQAGLLQDIKRLEHSNAELRGELQKLAELRAEIQRLREDLRRGGGQS